MHLGLLYITKTQLVQETLIFTILLQNPGQAAHSGMPYILWLLLLTWFNFNAYMDKELHQL